MTASPPAAKRFHRIFLTVLDSAGIGGAPDAARFSDEGSDTLGHVHERVGLSVPTLARLGLRRLMPLGDGPVEGAWGAMVERSAGKDTTTGHWEIAGAHLTRAFPTFPRGFPKDLVEAFEEAIGRQILCNRPASGTAVLDELGAEHMATGKPIVYTSGDSVFQIAAHTGVVSIETLYTWCEAARALCRGPYEVGRVIARPFSGEPGAFERDQGLRRDLSIAPPAGCLPEVLDAAGVPVHAIGKIEDIFAGRGITSAVHTATNVEGVARMIDATREQPGGLVFTNLVDFDSLYGHRNDPEGYAGALEEADRGIASLIGALGEGDLLILTADHGNDPTTASTDHSRERVPLLCWRSGGAEAELGTRATFADLGQTIAANWGLAVPNGTSFLEAL